MSVATAPTTTGPTLLRSDRCDRCGAQAYVRAVFAGGDLLFCGHHWKAFEPAAAASALAVTDQRDQINAKPSPAAY